MFASANSLQEASIVGISSPVSSKQITASETVVRVTPASAAAAPTMLHTPGITHACPNGSGPFSPPDARHASKRKLAGYWAWSHSTRSPALRPASAPTARVGMKIPAGSLILPARQGISTVLVQSREAYADRFTHPNVTVVRAALRTKVSRSDPTSGNTCVGRVMHNPASWSSL